MTLQPERRYRSTRPVLTAHPTESTRRLARVADMLPERRVSFRPPRDQISRREVGHWLTDGCVTIVRPDGRVSTVRWHLETRPWTRDRMSADVRAVTEDEFDVTCDRLDTCAVTIGNWAGGDRDGNPFVTEVTMATARRASFAILGGTLSTGEAERPRYRRRWRTEYDLLVHRA
jgi:phosphoenolpyruvate carboxylase